MNRKEIEQRKYSRLQLAYDPREIAQLIQALSPECKGVNIYFKLSFLSTFGKREKEIKVELGQNDKAYWYHECLNGDCTGWGFSLTDKIRSAVMSRQITEGILRCEGKEDWKYIDHNGCSCCSECKYRIVPLF